METTPTMRFGRFELDVRSRELRSGATRLRLQDQPFEILRVMLERPGEVITRDELRLRLWPAGTFVDFEHSLNAAIKRLRSALGDDAERPTFIETIPRRGYRFIAETAVERRAPHSSKNAAGSPPVRLVVLPFSNLSDDSSQEYFSDGLTEELIAQLGPLCRGQVGIIARWSSMFYKGSLQRASEIGAALHADYLLEGSTRRDGSRVRITARLIEAATEALLWSETYERTVSDWLTVQADVAGRVARSLLKELVPEVRPMVAPDERPEAYQAYLRGRYHWAKPSDSGLDQAIEYLNDAVRMAPDFAAAQGALARVHVAAAEYYHQLPRVALAAAREAAWRALELDPRVSEAQAVLADVIRLVDLDWDGAESAYTQALALNASNEAALRSYGLMLALLDRPADAIAYVDQASALDPLCLVTDTTAAWIRYLSGDFDVAIARSRHALSMDSEFVTAHRVLAASLLQVNRGEEAVAQLERALMMAGSNPVLLAWLAHAKAVTGSGAEALELLARACALESTCYVPPFHIAIAHTGLGNLDAAFAALDQAWLDRDPAIATLEAEPRFEPLRSDPRYPELVERLNFPRSRVGV